MNCKPNELAIIVYAEKIIQHTIGKIVELGDHTIHHPSNGQPCWVLKKPFLDGNGECIAIADTSLRPIRDNDGEDESLTWAGKPNAEKKIEEKLKIMREEVK